MDGEVPADGPQYEDLNQLLINKSELYKTKFQEKLNAKLMEMFGGGGLGAENNADEAAEDAQS